jgi:hypothetical protein
MPARMRCVTVGKVVPHAFVSAAKNSSLRKKNHYNADLRAERWQSGRMYLTRNQA